MNHSNRENTWSTQAQQVLKEEVQDMVVVNTRGPIETIINNISNIADLSFVEEISELLYRHEGYLNSEEFKIEAFYIISKDLEANGLSHEDLTRAIDCARESGDPASQKRWKHCLLTDNIATLFAYDVLFQYLENLKEQQTLQSLSIARAKRDKIRAIMIEEIMSFGKTVRTIVMQDKVLPLVARYYRISKLLLSDYVEGNKECTESDIEKAIINLRSLEISNENRVLNEPQKRAIEMILIAPLSFKQKQVFLSSLSLQVLNLLVTKVEVIFLALTEGKGQSIEDQSVVEYIQNEFEGVGSREQTKANLQIDRIIKERMAKVISRPRNCYISRLRPRV